jgi:hypothetical protein
MRSRLVIGLVLSAAVVLTACGGGDGDDQADDDDLVTVISSTTQSTAPSTTGPSLPSEPDTTGPPGTAAGAATTVANGTTPDGSTTTAVDGSSTTTSTTADVPGQSNLSVDDEISTIGLGPVFVGMTVAEATQAAGTPLEPEGAVRGRCTFYRAADFADPVSWLVAFDRIAAIHVESGPITTRSGLGIGTPAQQVRDTFGDQIQERPSPSDPAVTELVFVPVDENEARQRVIFEVDGSGSVVRFRSGQLPEVEYGRDCQDL